MSWLFAFTPEELTAIRLSLRVAFWAMLGSLPVGVAIALVLSRGRFWGKSLLNVVVHLPLIMPPVVTGYLLLLSFGRKGPIGAFLADTFGIVYSTDAAVEPGVRIIDTVPPDTHPPIVYPIALTATSANPDAPSLLVYLRGAKARAEFQKAGFTALDEAR